MRRWRTLVQHPVADRVDGDVDGEELERNLFVSSAMQVLCECRKTVVTVYELNVDVKRIAAIICMCACKCLYL